MNELFLLDDGNKIIKKVKSIVSNSKDYRTIMDAYMIGAIRCSDLKIDDKAWELFNKAIEYGEDHIRSSKKDYYDALNCAYSWVGVIYYNSGYMKEALTCFKRIIELYNKVKDDSNYNVNEKESVPIARKYIDIISNYIEK